MVSWCHDGMMVMVMMMMMVIQPSLIYQYGLKLRRWIRIASSRKTSECKAGSSEEGSCSCMHDLKHG